MSESENTTIRDRGRRKVTLSRDGVYAPFELRITTRGEGGLCAAKSALLSREEQEDLILALGGRVDEPAGVHLALRAEGRTLREAVDAGLVPPFAEPDWPDLDDDELVDAVLGMIGRRVRPHRTRT